MTCKPIQIGMKVSTYYVYHRNQGFVIFDCITDLVA